MWTFYPQHDISKNKFGYFTTSNKEKEKENSLTAQLKFPNPEDVILNLSTEDKVFKRI